MELEENRKKHILCYGDSNTWGFIPGGDGARLAANARWPGVMSKLLRTNYRITEEGLCGRTTVHDDPFSPGIEMNGLKLMATILDSHKPIDLVIIFLGVNDLKYRFSTTATDVANGVETLVRAAVRPDFGPSGRTPPDVLVITPPAIWEVANADGPIFKGGREKSIEVRDAFTQMSKRTGVPLLYAEDFVASDPTDGIHLSEASHGILGQEVAKWVLEWFESRGN